MAAPEDEVREGTVGLDDGRVLGYREYGDSSGVPLIYLQGMPGSRLDPAPLRMDRAALGGASGPQVGRHRRRDDVGPASRKDGGSYGKPKNGLEREIVLRPEARVLDQVPRRDGSPFVFHTATGKPLSKSNLYYPWKTVRDGSGTSPDRITAGIRPLRFHDLRHFCATRLLEMGATHFTVSVQLGHEDGGALVMSRYGHPSKDAAREQLRALDTPAPAETGSRATVSRGR